MDDEVILIPDDNATKRRLPLWMIGVAGADRVRHSEAGNENAFSNVNEGNASRILPPKSKRTRKGFSPSKQVDSRVLVKCARNRRGRKLIQEDDEAGSDYEVPEAAADKKRSNRGGKKGSKSSCRKQGVANGLSRESSEEIETESPEDGELTVNDLMSIAQEYIAADKHKEQQQSLHTEQDTERRLSTTSFSGKKSGGLPCAPQSSWKSSSYEETVSLHNSVQTSAGEGTVVKPSRTGDPAQDMLDLLLGPLYKPAVEKRKIGLMKEDMTFTDDIIKQRQNNIGTFADDITKQRQNNIGTEAVVPLTKKKSSLKDKVAMFLD